MSQHDFDIAPTDANTGASMRAEINSALQALASNSAGVSEPYTTYPFQVWADTTTGKIKIRNSSNTAWLLLQPDVYTHVQTSLAKLWSVVHNKNTSLTPVASIYQTIGTGTDFIGYCGDGTYCGQEFQSRLVPVAIDNIEIVSVNQLKITLKTSIIGKAVIQFF